MSEFIPRNLRSLACRCYMGCKPDQPRFFPARTSRYIVRTPCVCPSDNLKCPTRNQIICLFCKKAHRLDVYRGTVFSTFSCLWCGNQTINTEEEIRAHLLECSHRPSPTVYTERNLCECEICPFKCAQTIDFKNNYTQTVITTTQECSILDSTNTEVTKTPDPITNVKKIERPEFDHWNICRFGNPPQSEPNDRLAEGWLEHYMQTHQM